jgi:hypothetical protein
MTIERTNERHEKGVEERGRKEGLGKRMKWMRT